MTSSVDRTRLRLGENVVLTLRIQGTNPAIPQPVLPPLAGLKTVGNYQTLENGPKGKVLVLHYLFSPTKTGHIDVPDLTLRIGGSTQTVRGFALEVESGVTTSLQPVKVEGSVSSAPQAQDLSFNGSLSENQVYVGQPVQYTLHLLTRRSVRRLDITQTPDFAGFRKVDDPQATASKARQLTIDGRVYLDVIVVRATLFPLEAGNLQVGSYTAQLQLEGGSRGGAGVKLLGGKASLRVLPLPASPSGFSGAVGAFALRVTAPAPARAQVGQPFTLSMVIEGTGFLPESPLTWPTSPLFSPYATSTEDGSAFVAGSFRTKRTITATFLPKVTGDAVLPPATMVFFDPAAGSYKTLVGGGGRISVRGGADGAGAEVTLAPLIETPSPGELPTASVPRELFLPLLLVPFAVNLLIAAALWVSRTFLVAPEKARARKLARRTRRSLARARRHLDARKAAAFHEHLSQALMASMDAKVGRPTSGLSRRQLDEALEAAGVDAQARQGILAVAEVLERARYAPERPTRKELLERYEAVEKWVKRG